MRHCITLRYYIDRTDGDTTEKYDSERSDGKYRVLTSDEKYHISSREAEPRETQSVLSLKRPDPADSGVYVCAAASAAGAANTSAALTVEFPPRVTSEAREFWSWDQRPVTLYCRGEELQPSYPTLTSAQFSHIEIQVIFSDFKFS